MSLFQAAVPPAIQALVALGGVLAKGEAHCVARKIDPAVLLGSRLALDMFPLTRQVQIATDMVKNGCARLAGVEPPSFPDTESSFTDLQNRIEKTLAYLADLSPASINGAEDRQITLKVSGRELQFLGLPYLTGFVLPNLYFHTTSAYLILRHGGVELAKMDFLGAVPVSS